MIGVGIFMTANENGDLMWMGSPLHTNCSIYCAYTMGVQYVMKTAQYVPKFYIYTLKITFIKG